MIEDRNRRVFEAADLRPMDIVRCAEMLNVAVSTVKFYVRTQALPFRYKLIGRTTFRKVFIPAEVWLWMCERLPTPQDLEHPKSDHARRVKAGLTWYRANGKKGYAAMKRHTELEAQRPDRKDRPTITDVQDVQDVSPDPTSNR